MKVGPLLPWVEINRKANTARRVFLVCSQGEGEVYKVGT